MQDRCDVYEDGEILPAPAISSIVRALLMELGRVQAAAGKKAEAKQTLDKVIAEFPESPYIEEAKRMLTELT